MREDLNNKLFSDGLISTGIFIEACHCRRLRVVLLAVATSYSLHVLMRPLATNVNLC